VTTSVGRIVEAELVFETATVTVAVADVALVKEPPAFCKLMRREPVELAVLTRVKALVAAA